MKKSVRLFTLIELLIVIVILGALAAMVAPRLAGRSEQARRRIAKADIESNISLALKMYEVDNGAYPSTEQGLAALLSKPSSEPVPQNWNGPYLEKKALDPWGNEYQYRYPGTSNAESYDLFSKGPDGTEGGEDDIKNW
jgi:general secretion pathway protein G